MAVRLALGSGRGRIVWESMLESLQLAAIAMPLSLGVSQAMLGVMRAFMPGRVVRFIVGWHHLGADSAVIGMTMTCGVVTAIVFGILPAIHLSRGEVADTLKAKGRTDVAPGPQRMRRALAEPSAAARVEYRTVPPYFFDVLRMPLLAGQRFADSDGRMSEPVAIVSESMARKFWAFGSVRRR
ncbi:MAG: hypothetical protein ACRD2I_08845 [Vicinamibacterales bacterium]